MSGRERKFKININPETPNTAVISEPNATGWSTVLETGLFYGEPVLVGDDVRMDNVRCPHCNKKLGDALQGTYQTTCPRCKRSVTITR